MHERADGWAGDFVSADDELEREFDARLVESSRLAFRVAFSVLRQREDAEDVAQDAFAKAHRHFRQLRDPARFRSWLVRMVWRIALDRRRSDLRDGQTTEFTAAADKVSGEVIRAEVTLTVVK